MIISSNLKVELLIYLEIILNWNLCDIVKFMIGWFKKSCSYSNVLSWIKRGLNS